GVPGSDRPFAGDHSGDHSVHTDVAQTPSKHPRSRVPARYAWNSTADLLSNEAPIHASNRQPSRHRDYQRLVTDERSLPGALRVWWEGTFSPCGGPCGGSRSSSPRLLCSASSWRLFGVRATLASHGSQWAWAMG